MDGWTLGGVDMTQGQNEVASGGWKHIDIDQLGWTWCCGGSIAERIQYSVPAGQAFYPCEVVQSESSRELPQPGEYVEGKVVGWNGTEVL